MLLQSYKIHQVKQTLHLTVSHSFAQNPALIVVELNQQGLHLRVGSITF